MPENKLEKDSLREEPLNQSSNKLLEFQRRVSAISKDSVNPFFKSKYFDVNTVIDTIKPILNEVGLVVSQPLRVENGKNVLKTLVENNNGSYVAMSEVLIPEITDIQKFGAALTYLRRYALVSLLLLQGEEDDDGNQNAPQKPKSAPQATTAPKAVSSTASGNSMSDKQNKYIHVLMKEKGVMHLSDIGIEKIEKPTMMDAKNIIDKLLAYEADNVPTITIDDGDIPR